MLFLIKNVSIVDDDTSRFANNRCEWCVRASIVDNTDISFQTLIHTRHRSHNVLIDAARVHALLQKFWEFQDQSRRRKSFFASFREPKRIQKSHDSSYKFSMLRTGDLHELYPASLNLLDNFKKSTSNDRKP